MLLRDSAFPLRLRGSWITPALSWLSLEHRCYLPAAAGFVAVDLFDLVLTRLSLCDENRSHDHDFFFPGGELGEKYSEMFLM